VDLAEPLGSETVLHGRLPSGETFAARLPGAAALAAGAVLPLRPAPEEVHVFDAETGHRLEPLRAPALA
jgi:sn-glycerol 3-phosphate transport system ATP-binding protein